MQRQRLDSKRALLYLPGNRGGGPDKAIGSENTRRRKDGVDGSASGDLYLVVSVRPHRLFERRGDNLHVEVPVPLSAAMLGGEVQVPTLKGKLALKIPPETQNGRIFRLTGQGMPHLSKSTRGDLLARVNIILPTKLSDKEKELFRQLNELRPA
jgi:DnaJ-class molecular chaperone